MKAKRPGTCAEEGSGDRGEASPTLPPWKAFVVQFSRDTNPGAGTFSGRVEHLNSSHRARFASAEELLAVLTRMLEEYGER